MQPIEHKVTIKEAGHPTEPYSRVITQTLREKGFMPLWNRSQRAAFGSWLGEPLLHTIDGVLRDRTWSASLPFLSTGNNPEASIDALCAYVAVGLWYIYDDVNDRRMSRYGNQTAFGSMVNEALPSVDSLEDAYQRASDASLRSWNAAVSVEEVGESVLGNDPRRIVAWKKTFADIEVAQHKRFDANGEITLQQYAQNSIDRTMFIGNWWQRTAVVAGDIALAEFIAESYPFCALAGQVRNDIANVYTFENERGGRQYSDFTNGKMTAITIATLEHSSEQDKLWIMKHIFGKKKELSDMEQQELHRIIEISGTLATITTWAEDLVTKIESLLDKADLSDDVKTVWKGWIYKQFKEDIVDTGSERVDPEASDRFIQAAKRLAIKHQF